MEDELQEIIDRIKALNWDFNLDCEKVKRIKKALDTSEQDFIKSLDNNLEKV